MISLLTCKSCGKIFGEDDKHAECDDCDACLCIECMDKYCIESMLLDKGSCPICTLKAISNSTLLAYLLNELCIDREEAEQAMRDKHADKQRAWFPLEEKRYNEGLQVGIFNASGG